MTKIKKIEAIYGKDHGTAGLEEVASFLKKHGYESLAKLIFDTRGRRHR